MRRTPFLIACLFSSVGSLALAQLTGPSTGRSASDIEPARRSEPITPVPVPAQASLETALGEVLFHDPRLSGGNSRSCASCHDLGTNGATAERLDAAPDGGALRYNTPTVFNAALAFRQDWEGDLRTLEQQADLSIQAPGFMAGTWDDISRKLGADGDLVRRFRAVYGSGPSRDTVTRALAAFERTLLTPDSRFDRWLRGEAGVLSSEEQEGYRLFKYVGCVSCHQGVAVGANLYQRTDVFQTLFAGHPRRMRVSSLRNVAATAPYFDDGSAPTLAEAVDRMAQAQLGTRLKPEQVEEIVAFLRTLTGRFRGRDLPTTSGTPARP